VLEWLALIASAFGAGAINAVAGGGTFLTFPALVFAGMAPLAANATSTVALWPGGVASAWGYRSVLRGEGRALWPLLVVSTLGGLMGALLALFTPASTFDTLVPFLTLAAAVLFTVGDQLRAALSKRAAVAPAVVIFVQLLIGVYGGYLGGGIGLLMLAALTLLKGRELNHLNGLKTVLGLGINLSASVTFIIAGLVDWPRALGMATAAALGGALASTFALRVSPRVVKRVVIVIGWAMTLAFFLKRFVFQTSATLPA